jgi:hypothetical protein
LSNRSYSLTQVAFSAAITVLLGIGASAILVRHRGEWLFYIPALAAPAIGSLWGVKGRMFAFLGATLASAFVMPLVFYILLLICEADRHLMHHEAGVFTFGAIFGVVVGAIFGGIVAAILSNVEWPVESPALPSPNSGEETPMSLVPPDSATAPAPSFDAPQGANWVIGLSFAVPILLVVWAAWPVPATYVAGFDGTVASADRIVVRDGGYNCCGPVDDDAVLFAVTDRSEIESLLANLKFTGETRPCMCCGFPGIDWYNDGKRIALTAVQHGGAIRWDGCKHDLCLSGKSQDYLVQWLVGHGVNEKEIKGGCGGPRRDRKKGNSLVSEP